MESTRTEKPKSKSLKDIVDIPPAILDEARRLAYTLYQNEKWDQAEVMLKGLLAADNRDGWALSVYGSMLRKQRKYKEALVLMETALTVAPDDENIRKMRDELVTFLEAVKRLSSAQ
jgi:tetratricopeptide (TPR) repeat protein